MADEGDKKEGEDGEEESPEVRVLKAEKGARTKLILGLVLGAIVGGTAAFFGAMEMSKTGEEEPVVEEVVEEEPESLVEYQVLRIRRLPAALTNNKGQAIGYYFLDIVLSMTTLKDHSFVAARLPFVQEAINKDIATYGISKKGMPGTIDYDNLPERLRKAINKIFGKERVKFVTLEKVSPGQ
jgi:hypothetical protein